MVLMTITQLDESFRLPFLLKKNKFWCDQSLLVGARFTSSPTQSSALLAKKKKEKGIQEMIHKKVVETKKKKIHV